MRSASPTPQPKPWSAAPAVDDHPAQDLVLAAVDEFRRRIVLGALGSGLLAVLGGGALLLLGLVVLDHLVPGGLPRGALLVFGGTWGALLLLGLIAACVAAFARRVNPTFAAQQLERAARIEHNALVNALLLARSVDAPRVGPPAMEQAAREMTANPHVLHAPTQMPRWPWALVGVALIAWLAYPLVVPKPVTPSVARLLGGDVAPVTATRLTLVAPQPDQTFHVGDAIELDVALAGRPVDEVTLELLEQPGGDVRREYVSATRRVDDGGQRCRFALAPLEVAGDVHYRFTAGDARLKGTIPVAPQPKIETQHVTITPPAYTGQATRRLPEMDIDALYGTRARVVIRANVAIHEPVFILDGLRETRTRMRVDHGDPQRATCDLVLTDSGDYRFEFADRWGYPFRAAERYTIRVAPDQPPVVTLVDPAAATTHGPIDVRRVSELFVVAADDVGVLRVVLVFEDTRADPSLVVAEIDGGSPRVGRTVPTATLPLLVGRPVRAWFEAWDGRVALDGTPTPQSGRSREFELLLTPDVPPPDPAADQPDGDNGTPQSDNDPARSPTGADDIDDSASSPLSDPNEAAEDDPNVPRDPEPNAPGPSESDSAPVPEDDLESFARRHGQDAQEAIEHLQRQRDKEAQESDAGESPSESTEASGDEPSVEEAGADAENSQAEPTTSTGSDAAGDSETGDATTSGADGGQPSESAESEVDDQNQGQPGDVGQRGPGQAAEDTSATKGDSESETGRSPSDGADGDSGAAGGEPAEAGESGSSTPAESDETHDAPEAREGVARASGGADAEANGEASPAAGGGQSGNSREGGPGDDNSAVGRGPQGGSDSTRAGISSTGDGGEMPSEQPSSDALPVEAAEQDEADEAPEVPVTPPTTAEQGGVEVGASTGIAETLDLLEMLERGVSLDPQELIDLGWPAEKATAFVAALERLHAELRTRGTIDDARRQWLDAVVTVPEMRAGRGVNQEVRTALDATRTARDDLRRIAPPAEQFVPTALQHVLDAYYRALAEHRAPLEK